MLATFHPPEAIFQPPTCAVSSTISGSALPFGEVAACRLPIALVGLGLDEEGDDLRVRLPYFALDIDHGVLYLGRAQVILEVETERGNDLIRGELHRQHAVGAGDGFLRAGDTEDRVAQLAVRMLADQQALALAREEESDGAEHEPDENRCHSVEYGLAKLHRRERAQGRDEDAGQRRAVLEEHHERGWILAPADGLVIAQRTLGSPELPPRHQPGGALEHERQRQHDIADDGVADGLRLADMDDSLVDRNARAQREDHQCDDETPEIELAPIAQGVLRIGT